MILIADIKGFEEYKVTSDGNVIGKKGKPLRLQNRNGYCSVDLYKDKKHNTKSVHRLVATAFIDNPQGLPFVNHKDENPRNNNVDNLEWCTCEYNNAYGTKGSRTSKAQMNRKDCSKAVVQMNRNGDALAVYPSLKEAKRQTGICRTQIARCCQKKRMYNTAGGYKWRWLNDDNMSRKL